MYATYCDFHYRYGVLNRHISVSEKTHRIVDAKFHKLPARHVEQPVRAQQASLFSANRLFFVYTNPAFL